MDNVNNDGNVDINFDNLQFTTARQVLLKYTNALQKLREIAEQKHQVSYYHFDNFLLNKYFQKSNDDSSSDAEPLLTSMLRMELLKHIRDRRRQIVYWLSYCFLMICLSTMLFFIYQSYHQMIQNRNFVYPSMRIWRRLTLPLIQRYPRLTELYDESCLMENPFYQMEDLNCDVDCAHVETVVELLDDSNVQDEKTHKEISEFVPFFFKINQSSIDMQDFIDIYRTNHDVFRRDAYRVQSTNRDITNLEELFSQFNNSNDDVKQQQTHSLWRCIRMLPARLLRPLLASSRTSSYLPTTGRALERFISFDTYNAPTYTLPDTECPNVYVQQLQGTRFIILRPTSECRHRCRTLSMRLPQSFVLSYNWWYWKIISAPDPVAETASISLIGSYC